MEGTNCKSKMELKKGPWTKEEDRKLLAYIDRHGHGSWRTLPTKAGLRRCGKSCRLRWTNYLRPDIKRGKFSAHEEKAIIRLHALLGNRWSVIAAHLPKRTDNEIKNYWNTRLKKRLTRMGIDPATHKPRNSSAAITHMAQWEAARLQAEARLARDSKLPLPLPLPLPHRRLTSPHPPTHLAAPPCLDVLKVWESSSIPSRFFFSSSNGSSLESPTSTLNFSSGVPTGSGYGACEQVHEMQCDYDGIGLAGSMDPAAIFDQDYYSMGLGGPLVGEADDSKNYWNYLLGVVSSPPALYEVDS